MATETTTSEDNKESKARFKALMRMAKKLEPKLTPKQKKMKTDFGRGLVICLVKFIKHFEGSLVRDAIFYGKWMNLSPSKRRAMLSDNPPSNLNYGFPYMANLKYFVETAEKIYQGDYRKALSRQVEMAMNAASDHLYDLEVPKGKDWDKIRTKANKLRHKALKIGHGFVEGAYWKVEDLEELENLVMQIALMIDRKLGLKPDEGRWT